MSWDVRAVVGGAVRWITAVFDTASSSFEPEPAEPSGQMFCPSCGFRKAPPLPAGQPSCESCRSRKQDPRARPVSEPPTEDAANAFAASPAPSHPTTDLPGVPREVSATDVLSAARRWIHARVPDHSKDIYALLNEEDGAKQLMQPFWNALAQPERVQLKEQLLAQGFPGTKTFDMLVHWATARLRVRLTEQLRTAMWGPRTQIVRGGLPGLGR